MARDDMIEAYREFAREQTIRFERAMRALSDEIRIQREELRLHREELRRQREESRAYFEHLDRRLDDLHADSRAHRQALLRILDRLDNGGAAPAG